MNKPISFYYKLSALFGFLVLLLSFLPSKEQSALSFVGIIIEVLGAVVLAIAGRSAKIQNIKPIKVGATMGLIYGVLAGISVFFKTITRAQMLQQLKALHSNAPTPKGAITNALHTANSPIVHLVSFVVAVVVAVLIGVIITAIAGAATRVEDSNTI